MDVKAQYELWDGSKTRLMGFTKLFGTPISLPSPTLVFNEGDTVEIKVRNMSQSAPHTIHLHGLDVNQITDGVPALSFAIPHDSTGVYTFIAPHAGTYLYHCHVISTLHVQAGMYGMIHVLSPDGKKTTWKNGHSFHKESSWMLSELDTFWHQNSVIHQGGQQDINAKAKILDYTPQYFLINGKSEQQLKDTQITIHSKVNEITYLRLANIGYMGNRIIFPTALNTKIISSDGRPLNRELDSDTLEIFPGERFGVLLRPKTEFMDNIEVEYFNLNTQGIRNTQQAPVVFSGFLSAPKQKTKAEIVLYPNPSKHTVYFKGLSEIKEDVDIEIADLSGRVVKTFKFRPSSSHEININGLAKGIYLVKINAQSYSYTKKLKVGN